MKKIATLMLMIAITIAASAQTKTSIDAKAKAVSKQGSTLLALEYSNIVFTKYVYKSIVSSGHPGYYKAYYPDGSHTVINSHGRELIPPKKYSNLVVGAKNISFNEGRTLVNIDKESGLRTERQITSAGEGDDRYRGQNLSMSTGRSYASVVAEEKARKPYIISTANDGSKTLYINNKQVIKNCVSIEPITTDFLSDDDYWFFKVENSAGHQKVVMTNKKNPQDAKFSIGDVDEYVKIVDAKNGRNVLSCYKHDGSMKQLWWDGKTTAERPINEKNTTLKGERKYTFNMPCPNQKGLFLKELVQCKDYTAVKMAYTEMRGKPGFVYLHGRDRKKPYRIEANNKIYQIISFVGIGDEYYQTKVNNGDTVEFWVRIDRIPDSTQSFNLIEGDDEGWNFYNVSLN